MQRLWQFVLLTAGLLAVPQGANAHFLWVVAGGQSPDGKVHLYFSEAAEPDSPKLLERISKAVLHQHTPGEVVKLPISMGTESLVATPTGPEGSGRAFFVSHNYGVMTRGEATFLLAYHAKCYDTNQPMLWTAVNDAAALPLEITPSLSGSETVLTVTWQGKPLADATITIEGEGLENIEGTTDKRGQFVKALPLGKKYSIRAKHVDAKAGKFEDKEYPEARHYSTLALELPAKLVASTIAPLDPPVTSFGGAIVNDVVYVYGGHLGSAHHYSEPGQSGKFLKLNLQRPSKWEEIGSVPKRTGTALVPYQGKVIRVGGFVATNPESEKDNLVSKSEVSSYDPATNQWTELTPLPQGRSSHDALVLGDHLYVVGGWAMEDGKDTVWHTDALVADLRKSPIVWESIKAPFQRRAVSLGEWQGKVVVIGGMQKSGGPAKVTAIYNPADKSWTEGPELQGNAMDGFGSSAFAIGDTLYVSTMSGKIQRLNHDGSRWDVVAQLQHPRFFHRMMPTADGQLVFVGGASMETGKVSDVEIFNPVNRGTAAR